MFLLNVREMIYRHRERHLMGLSTSLTILAVCLAIGIDCRRPVKRDMTKNPRIIYGTRLKYQKFPFMAMQLTTVAKNVQSMVPKYVQTMCGASLIADNVLLTAGHCVTAMQCTQCDNYLYGPRHYAVYIGGYQLNGWNEQQIAVDSVIIHDDYNKYSNDIALLILAESLELSNDVAIIALPNISDVATLYKDGAPVTVIGWGVTETGHISDILMKLDQIMTPASNCTKQHGDLLHPGLMCTGTQPLEGHAYYGDSGGPLFTKYNNQWVQLGVVSYGVMFPDDRTGWLTYDVIYTNVSYYRGWIDQQLSSLTDALETVNVSSTPQTFDVTNPRSYYYKVWHLYAPDHEYVSVEILSGHLESGKDFLELYDGSNDKNKIIIQLSGVMSPANYTSSNDSMTVILKCSEKTEKTVFTGVKFGRRGVIFNVSGSDTSSTDNGPKCAPGFFACENKEQCIIASLKCTNRAECFDGSDENFQDCLVTRRPTPAPTQPPPPPPTKPVSSSTLARSNVIVSFMAVFTIFILLQVKFFMIF